MERLDAKIDQTAAETQAMLRVSHGGLDLRVTSLEGRVDRLEDIVEPKS